MLMVGIYWGDTYPLATARHIVALEFSLLLSFFSCYDKRQTFFNIYWTLL